MATAYVAVGSKAAQNISLSLRDHSTRKLSESDTHAWFCWQRRPGQAENYESAFRLQTSCAIAVRSSPYLRRLERQSVSLLKLSAPNSSPRCVGDMAVMFVWPRRGRHNMAHLVPSDWVRRSKTDNPLTLNALYVGRNRALSATRSRCQR